MAPKWAILLPLTSKGGGKAQLEENVARFFSSLETTASLPSSDLKIYVGVDEDDTALAGWQPPSTPFPLSVTTFSSYAPGSICRIWRDLARIAYEKGGRFFVLLGDDVELKSRGWTDAVEAEFARIATSRGLPLGFGCVALHDLTFPGFPSFPVVSRTHFEANAGELFSDRFVNQDADPFLFQLYRRFGAASYLYGRAQLTNGAAPARYAKVHHGDWADTDLETSTDRLARFLAGTWSETTGTSEAQANAQVQDGPPATSGSEGKRLVTLDVGVPSYRVDLDALDRIVALVLGPGSGGPEGVRCDGDPGREPERESDQGPGTEPGADQDGESPSPNPSQLPRGQVQVPEGMDAALILVVDDPSSPQIEELKRRYEWSHRVRIRVNRHNLGASATRNRILDESAADYVLFLDDDVAPSPDILSGCLEAIQAHATTTSHDGREKKVVGFVGSTRFSPPCGIFTSAVLLSGCAFFWNAAETYARPGDEMPWGVTASLLVKRGGDGVRFDPAFPRTGGGEDIAFCFDKCSATGRSDGREDTQPHGAFVAAPCIQAVHPWWREGGADFGRFYGWAFGDSLLLTRYPQFTYVDAAPNGIELVALSLLPVVLGLLLGLLSLCCRTSATAAATLLVLAGLSVAPCVVVAEALHDLIRYHVLEPHVHPAAGRPGTLQRIATCIVSALIRLASEMGRFWGPIARGDCKAPGGTGSGSGHLAIADLGPRSDSESGTMLSAIRGIQVRVRAMMPALFMRRFDWFKGQYEPAIRDERRMRLQRFSLFLCLYAASLRFILSSLFL